MPITCPPAGEPRSPLRLAAGGLWSTHQEGVVLAQSPASQGCKVPPGGLPQTRVRGGVQREWLA